MPLVETMNDFKADLSSLSSNQIYDKYIAVDECLADLGFDQHDLRRRISARFRIPLESVVIVGSAKLGFTLVDKRRHRKWRPAFSAFDDDSDVDVAVVAPDAFDEVWKACFDYWHRMRYNEDLPHWEEGPEFRRYIFRGWMRPDKLPLDTAVSYRRGWFEFFRRLVNERRAGDHSITAGLYRDHHFLKQYQTISIDRARSTARYSR